MKEIDKIINKTIDTDLTQQLETIAYERYLYRQKHRIAGTAMEDWNYAKEHLKERRYWEWVYCYGR